MQAMLESNSQLSQTNNESLCSLTRITYSILKRTHLIKYHVKTTFLAPISEGTLMV